MMLRRDFTRRAFTAAAFFTLIAAPATGQSQSAQPSVLKSTLYDYRVVTVVDGLVNPWGMAFLPGGDILVTERPGRLRIIRGGKLLPTPVEGVPAVVVRGQGGLLDVALHPNFSANKLVYLTFSKPLEGSAATTAVVRGTWANDKLTNVQEIFVADTKGAPGHFGSRIAFDKNGFMFISVGDRQAPPSGDLAAHPAQSLANHQGKIIRLHDDGRVPTDNPFVDQSGAKKEIWSYGHRNPQGIVIHPVTGDLWEIEHGPQGGDELNLIKKGANYGWPVIGFGVNYGMGARIHESTRKAGMEQPMNVWVPSIATSSVMIYTGDKFPLWKNSFFVTGLAGEQLARLTMTGETVDVADILLRKKGRLRDVAQGLDGFIYVAIEDNAGKPTPIVRLEPVARK